VYREDDTEILYLFFPFLKSFIHFFFSFSLFIHPVQVGTEIVKSFWGLKPFLYKMISPFILTKLTNHNSYCSCIPNFIGSKYKAPFKNGSRSQKAKTIIFDAFGFGNVLALKLLYWTLSNPAPLDSFKSSSINCQTTEISFQRHKKSNYKNYLLWLIMIKRKSKPFICVILSVISYKSMEFFK